MRINDFTRNRPAHEIVIRKSKSAHVDDLVWVQQPLRFPGVAYWVGYYVDRNGFITGCTEQRRTTSLAPEEV